MNKERCINNFASIFNTTQDGLGAVRANLLRLLRSLDLVQWNSYEESGKLDRKAFTRFATGSQAVFSKKIYAEAERSAVSVLIDCSGSMIGGRKIAQAESVAIQLAKILDKANVSFEVNGFHGDTYSVRNEASGANVNRTRLQSQHVIFIPFKQWGESLSKASPKMGSIGQWADNSTPDYSALSIVIENLARRLETKKILFLITDADGYRVEHMKHLQKLADTLGIKIIAIGIGHTDVKECFTHADNILSADGLASSSFNTLLKSLR